MFDRIKNRIRGSIFLSVLVKFVLFIIIFVIFNGIMLSVYNALIRKNAIRSTELLLNSVSNTVNQQVQQVIMTSNLLCFKPEIFDAFYDLSVDTSSDIARVTTINKALQDYKTLSSLLDSVVIVDRLSGNIYANSGASDIKTFYGITNIYEDYPVEYWESLESPPYGYEAIPPTKKNNKNVIPVIIGSIMSGNSTQLLVVDIDCQRLMDSILDNVFDADDPMQSDIYIYNSENGIAVAQSDEDEKLQLFANQKFIDELNGNNSFIYNSGGEKYLVIKSGGIGGVIQNCQYISMIPMRSVTSGMTAIAVIAIISTLLAAAFLLWLAVRSSASVYEPFRALKKKVQLAVPSKHDDSTGEINYIFGGIESIINSGIDMKNQLANVMPMAAQQCLMQFIESDDGSGSDETEEYLHRAGIDFTDDFFAVAYIRFRFLEKFYNEYSKDIYDVVFKNLEVFFEGLFGKRYKTLSITRHGDSIILIINIDNDGEAYENVTKILNDTIKAFDNDRELLIVKLSLSAPHQGMDGMRKAYEESRKAGAMQISSLYNEVNVYRESKEASKQLIYSIDDDNKLYHCIIKGDIGEAEEAVRRIAARNVENGVGEALIKQLYKNIYIVILKAIATKNVTEEALMLDSYENTDTYYDMSDCGSWIRYVEMLLHEAVKYSNLSATRLDIDGITEYIEQNYKRDLYLDSVAEKFHTTSKYLSKIFKQHTGVNFAEYVTCLRIEEAKRLLTETNMKINDIFTECGFYSRNTFIRNFKNHVGVLPSEYRSMIQNEGGNKLQKSASEPTESKM